jgi:hypothetical protein
MKEFFKKVFGVRAATPTPTRTSLLPHRDEVKRNCTHKRSSRGFTVMVMDHPIEFLRSDICPNCLEVYLNRFSTPCADCGEAILPGMSVGHAHIGATHPYTHLRAGCGCVLSWCGTWGEGRLIQVDETHDTIESNGAIVIQPKRA